MKKILPFLLALFLPAMAFAGTTVNPHTGQLQLCLDIQTEDGNTVSYCPGTLKVTNGTLTDNGDGTASLAIGASAGDIESVTAGAGLTGGGTSGAVTLDIGAGTAMDINADDIAWDSTEVEATTWGAGGNASNIWSFNLSGTDHTMTAGSGLMSFSHDIAVLGDNIEATTETDRFVFMANGSTYAPEAIDLGTDTTGNYVASATADQGLVLTGSEAGSLGFIDCAANEILKRNAGDTAWGCAADADSGGATAWSAIGDAAADGSIDFVATEQDIIGQLDSAGKSMLTITNQDADAANTTAISTLAHYDWSDSNVVYQQFIGDADGTPKTDFKVAQSAVGGITINVGATGVVIYDDADGAITFFGLGNGNQEDLTWNYDDGAANTVEVTSSTGVTNILFPSIDLNVPDEVYGAGWNGSTEVPTKNAVYDKIETVVAGSEVNNLETIATGIQTTEIPIGTAADTVVYAALSGDVTMTNAGVVTIGADKVALTTDTTGGYAASTTEAGGATSLEADGVDALTEIAQGIKTAADDTSKLVVGTAGANGEIAKWNTDGTLTDYNVTFGTLTDGKWCTYASAGTVLSCTQDAPAGSGDVTGVGDCADGACYDGSADGGTYARLYDGDSHYGALTFANLAANRTVTFGDMDLTFNQTLDSDADPTFDTVTVDTEAYDATGWNGDLTVPTKDAVRDKIETISGGSDTVSLYCYDTSGWAADRYVGCFGEQDNTSDAAVDQFYIGDAGNWTFEAMYCEAEAAPGAGQSWDIYFRFGGVSVTNPCTIADTNTTCTLEGQSDAVAGKVNTFWDEIGTAANSGDSGCHVLIKRV